jgi:putative toxin-antitoxin system antitoxin component (TIGR02293 family)
MANPPGYMAFATVGVLGPAEPSSIAVIGRLERIGFSREEINRIVASRRTLDRRIALGGRLSQHELDRAERMSRIHDHALRVFGDPEKVHRWLRKPSRALDGAIPIKLIETESGALRVAEALHALDYGMFL